MYKYYLTSCQDVVESDKIEIARDEGGIRVTGGLSAGERVVTAGIHSLKERQQVRIEQEATR